MVETPINSVSSTIIPRVCRVTSSLPGDGLETGKIMFLLIPVNPLPMADSAMVD
jgi:hypothetical protein